MTSLKLITSPKPHLLMQSPWGLDLQHMNFGGHTYSVHRGLAPMSSHEISDSSRQSSSLKSLIAPSFTRSQCQSPSQVLQGPPSGLGGLLVDSQTLYAFALSLPLPEQPFPTPWGPKFLFSSLQVFAQAPPSNQAPMTTIVCCTPHTLISLMLIHICRPTCYLNHTVIMLIHSELSVSSPSI